MWTWACRFRPQVRPWLILLAALVSQKIVCYQGDAEPKFVQRRALIPANSWLRGRPDSVELVLACTRAHGLHLIQLAQCCAAG